jgi:hypothetical protein
MTVRKQNGSHFRIPFLWCSGVLTSHLDPDQGFPSDVLPEITRTSIMRATLLAYNISNLIVLQATRVCSPPLLHARAVHTCPSVRCSHTLLSHCMTTY